MDNREMIKSLNDIKNSIRNKEYSKVIKIIDDKIAEIIAEEDSASAYIDNLVSDLK